MTIQRTSIAIVVFLLALVLPHGSADEEVLAICAAKPEEWTGGIPEEPIIQRDKRPDHNGVLWWLASGNPSNPDSGQWHFTGECPSLASFLQCLDDEAACIEAIEPHEWSRHLAYDDSWAVKRTRMADSGPVVDDLTFAEVIELYGN